MESIKDLSWVAHLAGGIILERFTLNGYSVVSLRIRTSGGPSGATYRYRMLFSEPGDRSPIYAVNLEASLLGDWVLTEQEADSHRVIGHAEGTEDYDSFRIHALEQALHHFSQIS